MYPAAKMSGSIFGISKEELLPKMLEFIDMIDGYGVILLLADDNEKEIQQSYAEMDVDEYHVQTVMGKNYRVNLFEDDSIEMMFSIRNLTYEQVNNFKQGLDELGFKHRSTYNSASGGLLLKSLVIVDSNKDTEDIMKLLALFKIE